jgi:hypothetical protein
VHDGGWLSCRGLRYDESLDIEAPDETLVSLPLIIGLYVTLIPSQAERRIGNLNHEEI